MTSDIAINCFRNAQANLAHARISTTANWNFVEAIAWRLPQKQNMAMAELNIRRVAITNLAASHKANKRVLISLCWSIACCQNGVRDSLSGPLCTFKTTCRIMSWLIRWSIPTMHPGPSVQNMNDPTPNSNATSVNAPDSLPSVAKTNIIAMTHALFRNSHGPFF